MTPTTIRATPTSAASTASRRSLRIAGTLPDGCAQQRCVRDVRRRLDIHGPVERGGGGRLVLEAERAVGRGLGDADRAAAAGGFAVDLHGSGRAAVDASLDEPARACADGDADRGAR